MRCARCRHENPDGARFCGACGEVVIEDRACSRCRATNPTSNRFCHQCGNPLAASSEPGAAPERAPRDYTPKHLADKILQSKSALEGERKQLTVLFADVKGSMELSERIDPEDWHGILDRFFQILTEGVHRFEGTVNQYTGDGIMALFGAPIAHEDHAQRACWAALWLRDELRAYADELRVARGLHFATRIGLNSGDVVVGKIGDDLRMDYTAQGHTVGLAQRMEQVARADGVCLSEHTAALVKGFFELRSLGGSSVRGATAPVAVYELEGVGPLRTRLDVSRSRGFSRFVGRENEMATLELALRHALDGSGQVVGVVGEAGVGKSRLCLEFVERRRAEGLAVHDAHCPAHGTTVPFLPLLELLRDLLGVAGSDDPQKAREAIAGRLLLLDRELEASLPLAFDFLGISGAGTPTPALEPEVRQRRLFAFLRRLVSSLSAREPTLILVDDLHWIDPASDAFLAQIVEAVGVSSALLLVNFRPEYRAEWMRRSYYQQLPLAPLGPEAIGELLGDLLGPHESLAGLHERIRLQTAGNPFFIEEMVHSLSELGALQGSTGRYRLVKPIEGLEVPTTVQALLAARIDRLAEREKQVLQASAVIGRSFGESTLARVADLPSSELSAALSALQSAEFVREESLYPRAEYAFRHPLTHQVAYEAQLESRRTRVHAAVARALEAEHAETLDEHASLLAHHWERAGEALDAARWHGRAAQWAGLRRAEDAVRHWRSCGEQLAGLRDSPEADALRLASCIGILRGAGLGGVAVAEEEIETAFREGRSLAEEAEDLESLTTVLMHYGGALQARTHFQEALPWIDEAMRIADRTGDRELRAGTRSLYVGRFATGQLEDVRLRSEEGLEIVDGDPELGSERTGQGLLVNLTVSHGVALCGLGRLREGFEELDRSIALANEHDQITSLVQGHAMSAFFAVQVGDLERAMRDVRELARIAESEGPPLVRIFYAASLGRALVARAEWDEAIRTLEPLRATPFGRFFDIYLAQAHLGRGDLSRARSLAEQAAASWRESGGRAYETFSLRVLAQVLRTIDAAGERETIEASLERAEELAHEIHFRFVLPFLHEERGRLAQALGRGRDTKRHLHEARGLFVEMGATVPAERLERELGA